MLCQMGDSKYANHIVASALNSRLLRCLACKKHLAQLKACLAERNRGQRQESVVCMIP